MTRLRAIALLLLTFTAASADDAGRLLIVGGALQPDNASVFTLLREAVPEDGTLAIIPAASGSPAKTTARFTAALQAHGLRSEQIIAVSLAVRDDDSTPDVDERNWRGNAHDPDEVAKLASADVIWFSGGDQRRLTETLLDREDSDTPMLKMIRERLAAGSLVGGTSAGAAIMSDPMITGGDPLAALGLDPDAEPLTIDTGLGFMPFGLVDQHFDARARLGRLAIAVAALPAAQRVGFGIDENTAMLYRFDEHSVQILGASTVTIIDGRTATWRSTKGRAQVDGLTISVLSPGDRLWLEGGRFLAADTRVATVDNEYFEGEFPAGGGIAMPSLSLARVLGEALLDRRGEDILDQYTFVVDRTDRARGAHLQFSQPDQARAFWGYDANGIPRYSVVGVGLDIRPVDFAITPVGHSRQPGSSSAVGRPNAP